ncbi:hypothetical protein [Brachyspira sp.]|uniref:hypothetical protein n=1 Tax=Brachyspira sp. TaxID=1977261 RepID=UPI003D7ED6AD
MSNIKILSAVLSFLLLFAISCSNEGTTGGNGGEDNGSLGYTHSNHPPEGDYKYLNHDTNKYEPNNRRAIVKIVNGNCNITGKAYPITSSINIPLDYDITVTSWYTYNYDPNTYTANYSDGATTSKPSSVNYLRVEYNTTNESISVSLNPGDILYSTFDLTRD